MNRNLERLTRPGWSLLSGTLIGLGLGGVLAGLPLAWVTVFAGLAVGVLGRMEGTP